MCLAVPGKIVSRQDMLATVDVSGVTRSISLLLLPDVRLGDFVLVHAGFAISAVDEAEACQTMAFFKELAEYAD